MGEFSVEFLRRLLKFLLHIWRWRELRMCFNRVFLEGNGEWEKRGDGCGSHGFCRAFCVIFCLGFCVGFFCNVWKKR